MTRARFEDLYDLHALGALDPPDREAFEAHLASGCPECREGLARALATAAALALAAPPAEPPSALRDRLLQRVRAEGPAARPSPGRRASRFLPLALAASLAALAILGVTRLLKLETPGSRLVALRSDPTTPRATIKRGEEQVGTAFFDREGRGILVVAKGLGPPEPGKTFVLWVLPKAGAPRNVGAMRLQPREEVDAIVREPGPFGEIAGVAVSEEADPSTGAPTKVVAAGVF
ncbi:MAG TPA: anti-sigma factor [Planctomycetota bacterium]|jgi:anti-sigma-K factor RskA|nr:anti-sigma factor [Planctomycetota bacterium]